MKFETLLSSIFLSTQFFFLISIKVNVQRWERSVQDEEDSLERCKQAESKHKGDIETDKQKIEQLKQEKNEKKKVVDQMEEETAKARRDVAALAKEIHNCNYVVSSIDTKIETKKNERHNLLIQCKVILVHACFS